MIPVEKLLDKLCALEKLIRPIFGPPQTLFSYGSIETFNVGLFVFLVGTGNPVPVTKLVDMGFEFLLELRTTIGLEQAHVSPKSSVHALLQEPVSVGCRECWSHENIYLSGTDIHAGEGKQVSKVNRIHLDDLSWLSGHRNGSSHLIFLPFGP